MVNDSINKHIKYLFMFILSFIFLYIFSVSVFADEYSVTVPSRPNSDYDKAEFNRITVPFTTSGSFDTTDLLYVSGLDRYPSDRAYYMGVFIRSKSPIFSTNNPNYHVIDFGSINGFYCLAIFPYTVISDVSLLPLFSTVTDYGYNAGLFATGDDQNNARDQYLSLFAQNYCNGTMENLINSGLQSNQIDAYPKTLVSPSNVWGDFFDNLESERRKSFETWSLNPPDNAGTGFSGIIRFYDDSFKDKNYGLRLNVNVKMKGYYRIHVPNFYQLLHPLTNFDKTEDLTLSYNVNLNNIDSVFRSDLNKYFFNFGTELFPTDYDDSKAIMEFYRSNAKQYLDKYETHYTSPYWNVDSVSINGFIYDEVNRQRSETFTVNFSDFDKDGQSNKSTYTYKDDLGNTNNSQADNTTSNINDMTNKDGTLTDYAKQNNWSLDDELNAEENYGKVSLKSALKDMRDYAEIFIVYLKDMFSILPFFVWSLLSFVIAFIIIARVLGR